MKCEIGIYGKAYDGPENVRAYTSQHQPDNLGAYNLGLALRAATKEAPNSDLIDAGLVLLRQLQDSGFGVFEIKNK